MRNAVLAGGMAALMAAAAPVAAQQVGAPPPAPAQPGAWGPNGWQAGAAAPMPTAYATAPALAAAPAYPPPPAYAPPAAYAPPVPPSVYDRIEPGRKVKGPALGNTVYDFAGWGLPQPPAGMRWIRYYDDAVLIDARDRAVDVRSVPWNAARPQPQPALARPAPYPAPRPSRAPGTYVERHGDTVVTTQVVAPPAAIGAMYGGYGQVVAVQPGTITTTTRTYWVSEGRPSRARRSARRR